MTPQAPVKERQVRISPNGSGREHYHVILSKTRGLDRVIAVATFDQRPEATTRAQNVRARFEQMGFTGRTTWAGAVLELAKPGQTSSYLMTRYCCLRHTIDG